MEAQANKKADKYEKTSVKQAENNAKAAGKIRVAQKKAAEDAKKAAAAQKKLRRLMAQY